MRGCQSMSQLRALRACRSFATLACLAQRPDATWGVPPVRRMLEGRSARLREQGLRWLPAGAPAASRGGSRYVALTSDSSPTRACCTSERATSASVGSTICIETPAKEQTYPWVLGKVVKVSHKPSAAELAGDSALRAESRADAPRETANRVKRKKSIVVDHSAVRSSPTDYYAAIERSRRARSIGVRFVS